MKILDHGYLDLVETWGSDARIVEAARMSTDKGFLGWGTWRGDSIHPENTDNYMENGTLMDSTIAAWKKAGKPEIFNYGPMQYSNIHFETGDEKLLAYLYRNKHATPFEMAGLVIEVKAPIFVFREWHRHRTQSYNEMSARYIPMPDENYIPSLARLMINSGGTNKQAGTVAGASELTEHLAVRFQNALRTNYTGSEEIYQAALAFGVPKELARLCIPVARYSKMRASANLRNWLGFLTLRMDPAAQWEIRQYANAVGEIIAEKFPKTWELFTEGKK